MNSVLKTAKRGMPAGVAGGYRFGFNGKENDNEVKGTGNQQDYGFRIYDPRLCKFLSVDPLFMSFPWYTPYQFAGNKPTIAIDLDGLEEFIIIDHVENGNIKLTTIHNIPPSQRIPGTDAAGNNLGLNYIQYQTRQYGQPGGGVVSSPTGSVNVATSPDLSPEGIFFNTIWRRADNGEQISAIEAIRNSTQVIRPGDNSPSRVAGGKLELRFNLPINFAKDKSTVYETNSSSGYSANDFDSWLDNLASFALDNPQLGLEITGYTDVDASTEHNRQLSKSRADFVKSKLVSRGLSQDRISTTGAGESQAQYGESDTEANKVKDRRIEVQFKLPARSR